MGSLLFKNQGLSPALKIPLYRFWKSRGSQEPKEPVLSLSGKELLLGLIYFPDSKMARASLIFILLICSFVNCHVIFEQPKGKEEKNIPNQPLISSVTRTKLHPHMIYQGSTTYTTLKKNYKKETHCYVSKNLLKWYQHYMSLQS